MTTYKEQLTVAQQDLKAAQNANMSESILASLNVKIKSLETKVAEADAKEALRKEKEMRRKEQIDKNWNLMEPTIDELIKSLDGITNNDVSYKYESGVIRLYYCNKHILSFCFNCYYTISRSWNVQEIMKPCVVTTDPAYGKDKVIGTSTIKNFNNKVVKKLMEKAENAINNHSWKAKEKTEEQTRRDSIRDTLKKNFPGAEYCVAWNGKREVPEGRISISENGDGAIINGFNLKNETFGLKLTLSKLTADQVNEIIKVAKSCQ